MTTYQTGTAAVTNGSATVTISTALTEALEAGQPFLTADQPEVPYFLAANAAIGATELTLSAPYSGDTNAAVAYQVTRDFTSNYGFPLMQRGDIAPWGVNADAFERIDRALFDRASFTATSISEVTIGTGEKTFTIEANKQFVAGQTAVISEDGTPANSMKGLITSYSGTTLVVDVVSVTGSGTISDWEIGISGPVGPPGDPGSPGVDWKGAYNAGTSYAVGDGVQYSGSAYICISATTGTAPDDSDGGTYWDLLASKGDAGSVISVNGVDPDSTGDVSLDGRDIARHNRIVEEILTSSSNAIEPADEGKTLVADRATPISFDLDPISAFAAGARMRFINRGAGTLTLNVGDSADDIEGESSLVLSTGESADIWKGNSPGWSAQVFGVGGSSGGGAIATSRAELKAASTSLGVVYLSEAGREGNFVWRAGDYSAEITADTQEGIFIKANAVASTSGAWIRDVPGDSYLIDWFGGVEGNSGFSNTPCLDGAVAVCKLTGFRKIAFKKHGFYYFGTKPAVFGFGVRLIGAGGRAFLVRNYNGTNNYYGGSATVASITADAFLCWDGSDYPTLGANGNKGEGLEDIGIYSASGTTAGAAIVLTGTDINNRGGYGYFKNVVISGDGEFNVGLVIEGSALTTSGAQGVRDQVFDGLYIFRCRLEHVRVKNGVNTTFNTLSVFDGGLSVTPVVRINGDGTATSNSQSILISGLHLSGNLALSDCNQVHVLGRCSGFFNAASVTNSTYNGDITAAFTNNSTSMTLYLTDGVHPAASP